MPAAIWGQQSAAAISAATSFNGAMLMSEQERDKYKQEAIQGSAASTQAQIAANQTIQSSKDQADGMTDEAVMKEAGAGTDIGTTVGSHVYEIGKTSELNNTVKTNRENQAKLENSRTAIDKPSEAKIEGGLSSSKTTGKRNIPDEGIELQSLSKKQAVSRSGPTTDAEKTKLADSIDTVRKWDPNTPPNGDVVDALETMNQYPENKDVQRVTDFKMAQIKRGTTAAKGALDKNEQDASRNSQKMDKIGSAVGQMITANGQLMNADAQRRKGNDDYAKTWADYLEKLFTSNMRTTADVAQTLSRAAQSFMDMQSNLIHTNAN